MAQKIETVPIDSLIDNPRNDKIHSPAQLSILAASYRQRGQYKPVLARKENRMLCAGHGVRQGMTEAGATTIQVIFLDITQDEADQILVADNRIAELAVTDNERRAALLEGFDPELYKSLGFVEDDIKALLGAEDEEVEVHQVDTGPVDDRFWISVRGKLADQAAVLDRIKTLLAEYPTVDVELGTTTDG